MSKHGKDPHKPHYPPPSDDPCRDGHASPRIRSTESDGKGGLVRHMTCGSCLANWDE